MIAKFPEPGYDYEPLQQDAEGRIYVYVHDGRGPRPPHTHQPQPQPKLAATNKKQPAGQPEGNKSYGTTSAAPATNAGEGSSEGGQHLPPPSYAQVVAGDNKVQTQE